MSKIIYLNNFKNKHINKDDSILTGKEYGKIDITVFIDDKTNLPFFYVNYDTPELIPIVDIIDEALIKSNYF